MGVKDFTEWVVPDLELELGGVTYTVTPPSTEQATQILACVVRAEHNLALVPEQLSPEIQAVLKAIEKRPLADITLGEDVHAQMVENGVHPGTINRMAYYAMFYWSRGEERADAVAEWLWSPKKDDEAGESPGEAPRR